MTFRSVLAALVVSIASLNSASALDASSIPFCTVSWDGNSTTYFSLRLDQTFQCKIDLIGLQQSVRYKHMVLVVGEKNKGGWVTSDVGGSVSLRLLDSLTGAEVDYASLGLLDRTYSWGMSANGLLPLDRYFIFELHRSASDSGKATKSYFLGTTITPEWVQ